MQAVSPRFAQTIQGSHILAVNAQILSQGVVVKDQIQVSAGSVVGDRGQFTRRTCTITINDPTLSPVSNPASLLQPFGNEIRLFRGIQYPAGDTETVCLGTFGIRTVEDNQPYTGLAVTGMDRCQVLAESRFPWPRTVSSTSAVGVLTGLVLEVFPNARFFIDPGIVDVPVPQVTWQTDRDAAIRDLAASLGAEFAADPYGGFTLQLVPDPASDGSDFIFPAGGIVSTKRIVTREGLFNAVSATGQATGTNPSPSAYVEDTTPSSPTWVGGPFGRIPRFYTSPLLQTNDQALAAATGILMNRLGLAKTLDFGTVVNPAYEPSDIFTVNFTDGTAETHVLDAYTIPLDAGTAATGSSRAQLGLAGVYAKKRLTRRIRSNLT